MLLLVCVRIYHASVTEDKYAKVLTGKYPLSILLLVAEGLSEY